VFWGEARVGWIAVDDLWGAIRDALPQFTPDECANFLTAAGYETRVFGFRSSQTAPAVSKHSTTDTRPQTWLLPWWSWPAAFSVL
jgi:hypothetical protein